jgi:hypothetical protein
MGTPKMSKVYVIEEDFLDPVNFTLTYISKVPMAINMVGHGVISLTYYGSLASKDKFTVASLGEFDSEQEAIEYIHKEFKKVDELDDYDKEFYTQRTCINKEYILSIYSVRK